MAFNLFTWLRNAIFGDPYAQGPENYGSNLSNQNTNMNFATNLFNGGMGLANMFHQWSYDAKNYQLQSDQLYNANQIKTSDMAKAGLNPILASGSNVSTGNATSGSSQPQNLQGNLGSSALQLLQQREANRTNLQINRERNQNELARAQVDADTRVQVARIQQESSKYSSDRSYDANKERVYSQEQIALADRLVDWYRADTERGLSVTESVENLVNAGLLDEKRKQEALKAKDMEAAYKIAAEVLGIPWLIFDKGDVYISGSESRSLGGSLGGSGGHGGASYNGSHSQSEASKLNRYVTELEKDEGKKAAAKEITSRVYGLSSSRSSSPAPESESESGSGSSYEPPSMQQFRDFWNDPAQLRGLSGKELADRRAYIDKLNSNLDFLKSEYFKWRKRFGR